MKNLTTDDAFFKGGKNFNYNIRKLSHIHLPGS